MNTSESLDRCFTFINCHLQIPKSAPAREKHAVKCITISRQSGCGAHAFGEELAAFLKGHLPHGAKPWTLFDRSLVDAVLEDHHLPMRLARFMPEDRVLQLDDIIEDIFSLHPPTKTLVRQTSETILRLAELGSVIIVGRGANIVTARLPGTLHVRLIASHERRVANMQTFEKLAKKEALERIAKEDRGRRRYVRTYFGMDIDDPLLYHLLINIDRISITNAVRMVGELALNGEHPEKLKMPMAA